MAQQWPFLGTQTATPGTYRVTADGPSGTKLTVLIKSGDVTKKQFLDVKFWVVSNSTQVKTAGALDSAKTKALENAWRARGNAIFGSQNIEIGTMEFVAAPAGIVNQFGNLELPTNQNPPDQNQRQLCQAFNAATGDERALHFALVDTIPDPDDTTGTTLGNAAGIPGAPVESDWVSSCVIASGEDGTSFAENATTAWHEAGHLLGLFHTSESAGDSFDPLPDTPQCPRVPNDGNNDGIVSSTECAALDGNNFMFHDTDATGMTAGQAFVLKRNPLMRPAASVTPNPLAGVVTRVAGTDRYDTSAALSRSTFAPGVPVVYLATGSGFADALAAGPVATGSGPVLLVRADAIPASIVTELTRLKPQRIVIVGGVNVVGDAVLNQARQFTTGEVKRISGEDRYATAAALSASQYPAGVGVVFIATGGGFADALAGGPAAGKNGPVLLVRQNAIPEVTASELTRLTPGRIVVLGGASAVSDAVVDGLKAFTTGTVTRRAGAERYSTSVAVSAASFQPGVPIAYLAIGTSFADALGAGALGGPLLLVRTNCVPATVLTELARLNPGKIIIVGGTGALGAGVAALTPC